MVAVATCWVPRTVLDFICKGENREQVDGLVGSPGLCRLVHVCRDGFCTEFKRLLMREFGFAAVAAGGGGVSSRRLCFGCRLVAAQCA